MLPAPAPPPCPWQFLLDSKWLYAVWKISYVRSYQETEDQSHPQPLWQTWQRKEQYRLFIRGAWHGKLYRVSHINGLDFVLVPLVVVVIGGTTRGRNYYHQL